MVWYCLSILTYDKPELDSAIGMAQHAQNHDRGESLWLWSKIWSTRRQTKLQADYAHLVKETWSNCENIDVGIFYLNTCLFRKNRRNAILHRIESVCHGKGR